MATPMLAVRPEPPDPSCTRLRAEVRAFLRRERDSGGYVPQCDSWLRGFDRGFTRKLGEHGWLGMTWPARYGGRDRPQRERFVVVEELLAAGAPVAAHWIAERSSCPRSRAAKACSPPAIASRTWAPTWHR